MILKLTINSKSHENSKNVNRRAGKKKIAQTIQPIDEEYKIIFPADKWNGIDIVPLSYEPSEGHIIQIDLREEILPEQSFRFYDEGLYEYHATKDQLKEINLILSE